MKQEKAIVSGKITINDQRITADYKPRSGDILCHHIHRHEPPVTADAIEIVYSDDNMLVVNKPSSIPVSFAKHLSAASDAHENNQFRSIRQADTTITPSCIYLEVPNSPMRICPVSLPKIPSLSFALRGYSEMILSGQ